MDEQRQDDELEPTYSSSVPIQDVALKTCRNQWTIEKGDKKGSGISVLMARHDDDDDLCVRLWISQCSLDIQIGSLKFSKIWVLFL